MSKRKLRDHLVLIVLLLLTSSSNVYCAELKTTDSKTESDKANAIDGAKVETRTAPSADVIKTETTTTEGSAINKSSTESKESDGLPHQSALPENWVPAKVTEDKPKEKPAPPGQAAAVKLYSQRKYAQAAAEFEKLIKNGTANPETHAYLAYCAYNSKRYTKALQQFDWVIKYCPDNYKLRTSAERYASLLRTEMAGICPQPCLKPNDPRWQRVGDHMEIHWSTGNGWVGVTDHHVGQLITVRNGQIDNQGTCPTCGGTGRITPLRDGAPLPN